ncbi:DUF1534 domain-containing protein [Pseudomonas syringae pv. tomato]|nr:DUF1534 domain-containing protein [Pseudomonas syringae pv. tomato]TES76381.1 DUF1534 domain-containing protein [Pseudomonas syringae pv. tomato]
MRRTLKIGRRASRTACDAERRTIVEIIVPHAPAPARESAGSLMPGATFVLLCAPQPSQLP